MSWLCRFESMKSSFSIWKIHRYRYQHASLNIANSSIFDISFATVIDRNLCMLDNHNRLGLLQYPWHKKMPVYRRKLLIWYSPSNQNPQEINQKWVETHSCQNCSTHRFNVQNSTQVRAVCLVHMVSASLENKKLPNLFSTAWIL